MTLKKIIKQISLFLFFIIGFITGIINPILWGILIILHLKKEKGYPFLNQNLIKRVSIYGIIISIIITVVIIAIK